MASGQSRRPISQRRCAPWLIRRDGAGNTLQHDPRSPQASPSAEHAASAKPGRQHWQARTGARSMWQRCARAVADPGSPKLPRGRDDEPNNAWHAERHGYDPTALRRAQAGTDHACDCAGPALLPARGTGPPRARPQLLLSLGLGPTAADFERRRADLRSERASLFGGSIEPEAREARQRHGRPPASFAARSLCAPTPQRGAWPPYWRIGDPKGNFPAKRQVARIGCRRIRPELPNPPTLTHPAPLAPGFMSEFNSNYDGMRRRQRPGSWGRTTIRATLHEAVPLSWPLRACRPTSHALNLDL
jgi:hypothetical protein